MASVVVTGGAGFVGSHIVDALLAAGHQVEVLDDLSSGNVANLPSSVKLNKLDIRSVEAREYLKNKSPDILVHAAAQMSVRVSMDDPSFDTHVNVFGLVNLLQAFVGKKLPHVVFLSTGGAIYGEQDSFPATENHKIEPASVYGLAKRVSELYLDLWKRQFGLTFVALRLGNVYGPRQNPHGEAGVVAIFCQKLLRGEIPLINGSGEQTRDFVFVKDVAAAACAAIELNVQGTFNIGTAKETSVNELYSILSKAIKLDSSPKHGEAKSGEQMRSCIDPSLALKTFGWKPSVDVTQGLTATADWFAQSK